MGLLILAYFLGWGWFSSAYYQRHLSRLATAYYQSYRENIINDSGTELAIARLRDASVANSGIFLTLNELLQGENGRFREEFGHSLRHCNPIKTVVRIIPREPFGSNDFDLQIHPVCD